MTLDHLHVMEEFTETLRISPSEGRGCLDVRVPTLEAFVLNKANIFRLRGGDDAELKAGKDLLYLRDILAGGEHPISVLEEDVDAIDTVPKNARTIRRAAYHLEHVAPRYHHPTAKILSERDGLDPAAARADVEGYLTDLVEMLANRSENDE